MTHFLTPGSQILNYLVFPKFLLEIDDLNETAKILYMILLDRARLSQKNDRWTDENGHVYLFFTIPSLADAMHKSEMTIKTALKALEEKPEEEEIVEKVEIPKAEEIGTSLGDLFKNIQL